MMNQERVQRSREVFQKLQEQLLAFQKKIADLKAEGNTHLQKIEPKDLIIEDAEVYEKLLVNKLCLDEYDQMASEARVLSKGTTRSLFYEFIGNELTKQQLPQ